MNNREALEEEIDIEEEDSDFEAVHKFYMSLEERVESKSIGKKRGESALLLLPHMLPLKFGNALLLQFIVNKSEDDSIGLLTMGFIVGMISLIIVLHSSLMGYIFKSFARLLNYKQERVEKVKRLAHLINNFFCVSEVLIIVFIFVYCLIFYDKVTFNNEEEQKLYVSKRIFVFTFVVSSIIFVCSVIAVVAIFIIKCFKHSINRYLGDKYPGGVEKEMFKNKIPASADYLISLGLANTLIGLYIGIDNQDIGDYVFIKDLALGVGLMTVLMTVFDRIITYLLYFSLLDNKVDHLEILILKSAHYARYCMALCQLVLFILILGQSIYLVVVVHEKNDQQWKCPLNLLEMCFTLSTSVVTGAVFTSVILIYLTAAIV